MMKKSIFPVVLLGMSLLFSACGSTAEDTSPESVTYTMPEATQLVIGTLMLEDTDLAVDAQLAAELLPLWRLYRSLNSGETAAPEELAAVLDQIQDTMEPGQLEAIAAMEIDQATMVSLMEELGISMNPDGLNRPERSGEGGFPAGMEGMPPGGFGGGQGPGGGEGFTPEMMATAQARRGSNVGGNRMLDPLLDALLLSLETISQP